MEISRLPARRPPAFIPRSGFLILALLFVAGAATAAEPDAERRDRDDAATAPHSSVRQLGRVEVTADSAAAVEVVPAYAGGQVSAGTQLGVLGDVGLMDAPFQVVGYTEETIREQQARSVADVLMNNDASVRVRGGRADIVDSYTIRGFPVGNQDIALNGLYGVLPYWRVPIEFAERVEVLKGPSALLYGMPPSGSVGGAINVVPKRAGSEPLTRLSFDYSSDAQFGTHLDVGRRFGEEKRFGVRFNGVYRQGDTAVEDQDRTFPLAALAFDYQGDRLRASLDLMFQKESLNGVMRPLIPDGVTRLADAPDGDKLFGMRNSWLDQKDYGAVAHTEYDLTDSITSFASFGLSRSSYETLAANAMLTNADTGDILNRYARQRGEWRTWSGNAGLRGHFDTGVVRHEWTLSLSRYQQDEGMIYSFYGAVPGNLYQSPVVIPVDDSDLDGDIPTTAKRKLSGLTVTDRLMMFDNRLQITLGARRQWVETHNYDRFTGAETSSYQEQLWTPLFGVAVEPFDNLTLYANAAQGISPGDSAPLTATNAGTTLAPYKTQQYEVGVKYDAGRFMTSLSAFQIKKPSAILDAGNTFRADGEQRNRGLELSLFGEPWTGLRVLSGVSYIEPILTHTEKASDKGNDAQGIAREQVNLGLSWDVPFQPGLTVDGRWIYTGSAYLDTANQIEAPSWERVDLGARYRFRAGATPVTVGANVENLFDEDYWMAANNYVSLGASRTLTLFVSVDL